MTKSAMTTGTDEVRLLRDAKAAGERLMAAERQLRDRHAAHVKEREKVRTAVGALEEVLANKNRLVDEAAARGADRVAAEFVRTIGGYTEIVRTTEGTRERPRRPHLPAMHGEGDHLTFEDLCVLVPDMMKARLEQIIRGSGARFGLPAEQRTVRLAELDAQIAALEAQHTELVDGAAEVGLTLPLLKSVQERREAEARRQERDQELARQRAQGIYPVTA